MKRISRYIIALSPGNLLGLYLGVVVIAGVVAAGFVFFTSATISHRSTQATREANASLISAQIQTEAGMQTELLGTQRDQMFMTPSFLSLPSAQQSIMAKELSRDVFTDDGPAEMDLPFVPIPLDQRQAAILQRSADQLSRAVDEILAMSNHVDAQELRARRDRYKQALTQFYADSTLPAQRALMVRTRALSDALQASSSQAELGFRRDQNALEDATAFGRVTMVLALVLLTGGMGGTTLAVGRLLQRAFVEAELEKDQLQETKETLQSRNGQLNALYNIFSEITDTLSLQHVVNTTLRETMRLMKAQNAILSLLEDGTLVIKGSLNREGEPVQGLPPVQLGEGVIGRVAKRGRTLRIDETNQDLIPDWRRESGARSALIVPLIVGARVVGILSCWSDLQSAFGEDEERILEMMATQVANAVIAADMTERSERRARRDQLTGLANRFQLAEDMEGELKTLAADGGIAVVAMIDIDHFKHVNDAYGHAVGDICLQRAAGILRNSVREKDRVYRYGGEEFVMIFADAAAAEAIVMADRLRARFESTPMDADPGRPIAPVTISIGLAVLPADASNVDRLIDLADAAMYRAKEAGGNRVMQWTEADSARDGKERLIA